MLLNYIKIAFRQITRNKLFTLINVSGLALSMSIGMLIIGMIVSLLKFDAFHVNNDRIFRVISETHDVQGKEDVKATSPIPLAEKLELLGAVDKTVRIRKSLNDLVIQGMTKYLSRDILRNLHSRKSSPFLFCAAILHRRLANHSLSY